MWFVSGFGLWFGVLHVSGWVFFFFADRGKTQKGSKIGNPKTETRTRTRTDGRLTTYSCVRAWQVMQTYLRVLYLA